jgi:CubicO group peptidase (beta-lactamase class C family)
MQTPADFSAHIAESRAKHIAPAIGAVWVANDGTLPTAMHGALPSLSMPHWHIGSCTKAMTATVFGRLVDRGLIGFETPLGDVLPERADQMTRAFRTMPMHAFLTHSSGIARDPAPSTFRALRRSNASATAQRLFLVADALKEQPKPDRGYSNLGYILLGAVIERVTGQSWEAALTRDVMIPLGIARFGFGPPNPLHLTGHRRLGKIWWPERGDNPQAYGPAGRVNLALVEWGRFLRAHFAGSPMLSPSTRERLHRPAKNGFAMGWLSRSYNGKRMLLHTGSNTAWFAQATLFPEQQVGIGVVCNAFDASVERAVGDLSTELIDRASGRTRS